jgi:hypothetical protein
MTRKHRRATRPAAGNGPPRQRRAPTRHKSVTVHQPPTVAVRGEICELSADGVGMVSDQLTGVGSLVLLTLVSPAGDYRREVLARVLHVRRVRRGWFHACTFSQPLAKDELRNLLA